MVQFTPVNIIFVWFEQNLEDSMIIDAKNLNVHKVDFAHATQTTTYTDEGRRELNTLMYIV